ncbi:hypothetical protein HD806DRAFT_540217 [Xylariaceae sp. AK1471]|nr:hypothetical protein HD806DRAFT_540217 [Xylariaceae sp. AK1471]
MYGDGETATDGANGTNRTPASDKPHHARSPYQPIGDFLSNTHNATALSDFSLEYIEFTSPAASEQSRLDCETICKLGLKVSVHFSPVTRLGYHVGCDRSERWDLPNLPDDSWCSKINKKKTRPTFEDIVYDLSRDFDAIG